MVGAIGLELTLLGTPVARGRLHVEKGTTGIDGIPHSLPRELPTVPTRRLPVSSYFWRQSESVVKLLETDTHPNLDHDPGDPLSSGDSPPNADFGWRGPAAH